MTCALLAALLLLAQSQPGSSVTFWIPKIPIELSGPVVEFDLRNVSVSSTWVLGVKADNATKPVLSIGAAELGPPGVAGLRSLVRAAAADPRSFQIQGGRVSMDVKAAQLADSGGVFIYAVVPQGTRVRCLVNGTVVADGPVARDLLLRNGAVVDEPVGGPRRVLTRLLMPKPPSQPR